MKKYLMIFISLLILTTGCITSVERENHPVITYEEAQNLIKTKGNVYIIDVRTREEYNSYHVNNAINVPSGDIERIREHDNIKKDDHLILYCQGGRRSSDSVKKLKEMGYTNVYDSGSINNWMDVK